MYLARRLIETADGQIDWQGYGLDPDAWVDAPAAANINWFDPDISRVPKEHRWPLLLAGYASALDGRRRISCPRQCQLNSILLAALKRGRDYLTETSGATEFFDEAGKLLQPGSVNPLVDSVMEGSPEFAPELAMLDREAEAYKRDLRRARKSIVYLPEAEAPSPRFFKTPREVALQEMQGKSVEVNAEDLLLADTFRIATSGIYLRDPECRLFQEWSRLDLDDSPLNAGFEFTAIADSSGRPAGAINRADYVFSVDPERANGRHLFTVWSRLETKEVETLRTQREASASDLATSTRTSEQPTPALGALLADPWFGGQSSFGTLVRTPARGTLIGPPGTRTDLRDDPIVEEVRTELEGPVYASESLVAGPQVTIRDTSASRTHEDLASQRFDLNAPLKIPPPQEGYYRFANVRLRSDVPIASQPALDHQIGEALWQVLYPEKPGGTPPDFAERHMVVTASTVGIWGDRGIAVAQKRSSDLALTPGGQPPSLLEDFAALVSLLRDVEGLSTSVANSREAPAIGNSNNALEATVTETEQLLMRATAVQHRFILPDRDPLRLFAKVIGTEQVLTTLRDLSQNATENLRRRQAAEQAKRAEAAAAVTAKIRRRLLWLQVLTVGFLGIVIADVIAWQVDLAGFARHVLLVLGGPVVIGLAALGLKPWQRKREAAANVTGPSAAILFLVAAACIVGWLAGLLGAWSR
jgi:hypothetical protein